MRCRKAHQWIGHSVSRLKKGEQRTGENLAMHVCPDECPLKEERKKAVKAFLQRPYLSNNIK
jgi:hypothetical protein